MFEQRDGENEDFERKSEKPVKTQPIIFSGPSEGTLLREAFISAKKECKSRTLTF